jgi:general secretion pathway protein D
MKTCRYRRGAALLSVAALLAGCASTPRAPSAAHLQRADVADRAAAAPIPEPVTRSLDLPPPSGGKAAERYTVVVNGVPASELLFSLARDARVNLDVHPDIHGVVTLNAIDQTLPQILDRVAAQVDMRWTLDGDQLSIVPDTPYLRFYRVDYLNMSRDTASRTSIATQVATTGTTSADTAQSTEGGNNSGTEIVNSAANRYWDSLVRALTALLQETDKLVPEAEPAPAAESNAKDGAQRPNLRFREAASVIAQPE